VLNEFNDIRRLLDEGDDFNELARTYSEEPGALQTGGDLGWFSHGRMVAPFDSAAFALEPDEVSEPVLTRFGYHLIKLHEKRERGDTLELHASHILLKLQVSGRTIGDLRTRADQFAEDARTMPWDSACALQGLTSRSATNIERGKNIGAFGVNMALEEFLFTAKTDAISPVISTDRFFGVCQLTERSPAGADPLEEIWGRVVRPYKMDLCADSARLAMEDIQGAMTNGKTFFEAAEEFGRTPTAPAPFGRYDQVPPFGLDPAFNGVTFSLTPENPFSPIFRARDRYCIVELIETTPADLEMYAEKRDSLFQAIRGGKENQVFQIWYDDLYSNAEVEDFRYQVPEGL